MICRLSLQEIGFYLFIDTSFVYGSSIQMSKQYCYMAEKPGKSPPKYPRRSRPSLTNVSGGSSILSGSTNTVLWTRAKQEPMVIQIRRRKWRWIGHTLRKEPSNITRQALEWNPQGKRKRGRPKQTWRRSLHSDMGNSQGQKAMEDDYWGPMFH